MAQSIVCIVAAAICTTIFLEEVPRWRMQLCEFSFGPCPLQPIELLEKEILAVCRLQFSTISISHKVHIMLQLLFAHPFWFTLSSVLFFFCAICVGVLNVHCNLVSFFIADTAFYCMHHHCSHTYTLHTVCTRQWLK